MLSVLGFAPPPEGNLELEAEEPPPWVFDVVENPNSLPQRRLPPRHRSTELPSVLRPLTNSGLEDAERRLSPCHCFWRMHRAASLLAIVLPSYQASTASH
ncbi:hypothetical protein M407DRAFT_32660 [Tulasnella calospora MUT 4182]|uniref:Uncharacterized protein n=1 Tax=Tulasnella calospora MUT 4182 TaxID=1051891 RepID=A0A0C3Q4B8_9AGAM|nr:hypothetical protein M407DRAFT_32660 [Tulasnella calospora MUT 4182]